MSRSGVVELIDVMTFTGRRPASGCAGLLAAGLTVLLACAPLKASQNPITDRVIAGRSITQWRELMSRIDLADRQSADFVPGLVAVMEDRDVPWFTRRQASLTLGRLGPLARDAVPRVLALIDETGDDPETAAALWSIKALALYGPVAAEATPILIVHLRAPDTHWFARLSLLEAISQIGPAHPAAIPTLIDAARDPRLVCPHLTPEESLEFQRLACESLGAIGPAAAVSTPIVARLLESDDPHLRRAAADSLARFGPSAVLAGPALADRVLFEEEVEVRDAALTALARTGPEMLSRVQPWLTADSPLLQRDALWLYREWGPAVRRSLPDVEPFFEHQDRLTRLAARAAAAKMTGRIALHLQSVIECLGDDDRAVRREAAQILIEWGKSEPAVAAAVERLQKDPRPHVRTAVHHVLEQISAQKP